MFLIMGWTAPAFFALAISIGGVVCIASANAGNTSQDLKTGFLVGATPAKQQLALIIGVAVSVIAIGFTLKGMDETLEEFQTANIPLNMQSLPQGVSVAENTGFGRTQVPITGADGKPTGQQVSVQGMTVINALNSPVVPDGSYFYNPQPARLKSSGCMESAAVTPQRRRPGLWPR